MSGTINGSKFSPLVDSASQINLVSTLDAHKWGLTFKNHKAKLGGIGGHATALVGIAEGVEIVVGGISSSTHFFVADGPVKPLLGRPFLFGREAKLHYVEGKGEILALKGSDGEYTIIPICSLWNDTWYDQIPEYRSSGGWIDVEELSASLSHLSEPPGLVGC